MIHVFPQSNGNLLFFIIFPGVMWMIKMDGFILFLIFYSSNSQELKSNYMYHFYNYISHHLPNLLFCEKNGLLLQILNQAFYNELFSINF